MSAGRLALFFGGACAGIATALLCAPRSGRDTRAQIRGKASDAQDFLKHQADEIRKTCHDTVERGKQAARTTGTGVVGAFQEGRAVFLR
jgi:gas vesicle protein